MPPVATAAVDATACDACSAPVGTKTSGASVVAGCSGMRPSREPGSIPEASNAATIEPAEVPM